MTHTRSLALALFGATLFGCAGPEPADLLLIDARVYSFAWPDPGADGTPNTAAPFEDGQWHPDAQAVAVRGDRIVFVGDAEGARAFQGPETQVMDLRGATVLPGLVESHAHITELGAKLTQVDLTGVDTEEEAVRRAVERAAQTPAGTWILGAGWDEGAWADRYPDWDLLNERIPDHPVYLRSLHGFAGWGNRMAFAAAGIDENTTPPVGGELLRNRSGALTGLALNRAVSLLDAAVPTPSPEEVEARVLASLEEMARSGYTAVHYAGTATESLEALERLAERAELPVRVYAMLNGRDTVQLADWLARGPDTDPSDLLQVRSVKAYYDGALGSRGARLLEDYTDRPGHRGVSGDGYGFDQGWMGRMAEAGFQLGIHAIGDAGNRETLDFLSALIAKTPDVRAGRHRIEHAQVVAPDDMARFGSLGLIASMEPPHAVEDKAWAEERLGAERIRGAYAWRSLRQAGAHLVFNSDLPGSDWSPFYGLHSAITRRDPELNPTAGWYPEEAVNREEAVRAYATWAAYASFTESEVGVLAPGRWADLTVLSVDPLTVDPAALFEGHVVATVVAGRVVAEP